MLNLLNPGHRQKTESTPGEKLKGFSFAESILLCPARYMGGSGQLEKAWPDICV